MTYTIHHYPCDKTYHHIFFEVVRFIREKNEKHTYLAFHWSCFEWMFARNNIDPKSLDNIIMFRNEQFKISGMLIFEDIPGLWFMLYDHDDELKKIMADYVVHQLKGDIMCPHDLEVIAMFQRSGYILTADKDPIAMFDQTHLDFTKPEGYTLLSLEDDYRLDQIHNILWRGFNHVEDVDYSRENLEN